MENEDIDLKKLQEALDRKMMDYNASSRLELDNLSPLDMQQILYNTVGEESPIGFKNTINNETLDKIPFLNLFEEYLNVIKEAKELKLTARGNLPKKLCLELYGKGLIKEYAIESGITKLSKEADSMVLQNLKIIGELLGLTKKRNNKLSVTKKGNNLLEPSKRIDLFKEIFITNFKRFNLGYHDGYNQEIGVQRSFGFTLYLLLRYGKERRTLNFYAEKSLLSFPFELDNCEANWSTPEKQYEHCLGIRIFERFLNYYGFIDYNKVINFKSEDETDLQTTQIFESVFELRKDKFQFKKNEHSA